MYCIWLRYYYSMTNIAYYSVIITIIMHYMKQVTTNISVKRASSYYRSSSPLSLSLPCISAAISLSPNAILDADLVREWCESAHRRVNNLPSHYLIREKILPLWKGEMRGFATEIRNGESSLQHEKADDNARLNEKRQKGGGLRETEEGWISELCKLGTAL